MYVEKFEANSLDQALKKIKAKLGPDAIILKTVTNKGLMGTLKKNKIEITAAISEDNYKKKAEVDLALGDKLKEKFYQTPSSHISKMISNYTESNKKERRPYGKLSLNKTVQKTNDVVKSGLDDFLGRGIGEIESEPVAGSHEETSSPAAYGIKSEEPLYSPPRIENYSDIVEQQKKIDLLERKIFELARRLEKVEKVGPEGLFQVRTTLKSFNLKESFIARLLKKAMFELSSEELEEEDAVLEVVLREMTEAIHIDLPLFSKIDNGEPTITVLLSESSSGQTSTAYKLSSLKENSILVRLVGEEKAHYSLSKKMFNIVENEAHSISDVVVASRKGIDNGQSVFIDYQNTETNQDDIKKFLQGLQRSFENVEVLTCLSSISSEVYNRRCLNRYGDLLDGVILTKLDQCLDFGSLINIHIDFDNIPLKFFTTGQTIPDDIEAATKERLLNGIFKFDKKL